MQIGLSFVRIGDLTSRFHLATQLNTFTNRHLTVLSPISWMTCKHDVSFGDSVQDLSTCFVSHFIVGLVLQYVIHLLVLTLKPFVLGSSGFWERCSARRSNSARNSSPLRCKFGSATTFNLSFRLCTLTNTSLSLSTTPSSPHQHPHLLHHTPSADPTCRPRLKCKVFQAPSRPSSKRVSSVPFLPLLL